MRARAVARAAVLALALACATAPGADGAAWSPVCHPPPPTATRATAILILGGGFLEPGWADMHICRDLARHGFRTVNLVYPLHDLPGAVHLARSRARRAQQGTRRPVFAVGLSVGGTLAELLAVRGEVDAAVAVAAPSDLLHWAPGGDATVALERPDAAAYWRDVGASRAERRAASPLRHVGAHPAPLLLFHSRTDEVVPFAQSLALRRRVATSRLRLLRGRHLESQAWRRPAFAWLARRGHELLR